MSTDAMVMIGMWIFLVVMAFVAFAYAVWKEEIDTIMEERARRRAQWHAWWNFEGDKPLTKDEEKVYSRAGHVSVRSSVAERRSRWLQEEASGTRAGTRR